MTHTEKAVAAASSNTPGALAIATTIEQHAIARGMNQELNDIYLAELSVTRGYVSLADAAKDWSNE